MIPVIRLDEAAKEETAKKLRAACTDVGFFYLAGHGIEETLLQHVFHETKRLFSLPTDTKKRLSDPVLSRGYTAMEEETLDPELQQKSGRGDTKEGYYIGRHVPNTDPRYDPSKLSGPNIWPDASTCPAFQDPGKFQTVMESYFEKICYVGFQTVRLLALALDLPMHHFDSNFSDPMAALRLLHYAAVRSEPEEGLFACGAHSDYGMLTLLLTDGTPGLQILTKSNEWINVSPQPEGINEPCFIVNLGDMLERWSNGLFRSTKHRVVTDGTSERYSTPFFYEPNFDTVVECLPICCSKENPPKYPPTTSGQHLLDKYRQTHADFTPK